MAFFDETDAMAGPNFRSAKGSEKNGAVIQFYHLPTIKKAIDNNVFTNQATFKAFITSFSDNFKTNWSPKETMGRMDPIQTFKNTQRTITLSFDVPSNSEDEAYSNFVELQKLIMMQYPVYETININEVSRTVPTQNTNTAGAAQTFNMEQDIKSNIASNQENWILQQSKTTNARFMSSPPLLYIKFMNWIGTDSNVASYSKATTYINNAIVGAVGGVSFKPDLDAGVHFIDSNLIPKLFTVDMDISIIHTTELGWVDVVGGTNEKLSSYAFGEPTGVAIGQADTNRTYPYDTAELIARFSGSGG